MMRVLKKAVSADAPILYLVGALLIVFSLLLHFNGVFPFRPSSYLSNTGLYLATLIIIESFIFLRRLFQVMPEAPIAFSGQFFNSRRDLYVTSAPLMVAAIIFMPMFSAMKSSIPIFTEYDWDQAFITADRMIFGRDAWLVFHPFLGFPLISSLLSIAYHLWFLLIYAGTVFFALYRRDLRYTYFLSFYLSWAIIGVILAVTFASVGPVFLEPLLSQGDFVQQTAYLSQANESYPVLTVRVQEILLKWHYLGEHGIGRGITAMPSMHVALCTIFWLSMRQVSRAAGWFFFAFLIVIFLGSVHLAYHYAVDGIASFALACGIWAVANSITRVAAKKRSGASVPATA